MFWDFFIDFSKEMDIIECINASENLFLDVGLNR